MELVGQQLIAAPVDRTWVALNDPGTLKACIAGCESIDRVSDNEYTVTMAVRIGPVNAKFKGKLRLENLMPPASYTINFEGQGGVAGFGKGSADVKLTAQDGGTLLEYAARAQVGGKIAQIGSRLVDAAAKKMADDFFAAFNAQLGGADASTDAATGEAATSGESAAGASPAGGTADVGSPAVSGAASRTGSTPGGIPRWMWAAGAAIAVIAITYFSR